MSTVVQIKNLNFQNSLYYKDVQINSEEVTFLTGPSGCGKSTLLQMLNATKDYLSGEILYKGKDIKDIDAETLRRKVLLVGQSVYLFDKSIRENFHDYYRFRDEMPPNDETIRKFLKICCADFDLDKSASNLSGGEKQRVYIAIFLSFMPETILLDEPTSALDHDTGSRVLENIINYCKNNNIAVIVVSHDKSLTDKFADKVIDVRTVK